MKYRQFTGSLLIPGRRSRVGRSGLAASVAFAATSLLSAGPALAQVAYFDLSGANTTYGTMSVSASTLGNASLGAPNIAGSLAPGQLTYNYISTSFVTTASGAVTVGQASGPSDSVVILYAGAFNPASPNTNASIGVDDYFGPRPAGVVVTVCGQRPDQCPQVTSGVLQAGTTITLLLTTWAPGDSLGPFVAANLTLDATAVALSVLSSTALGSPLVQIYVDGAVNQSPGSLVGTTRNLTLDTGTVANNIFIAPSGGSVTATAAAHTLSGVLSGTGAITFGGAAPSP